jgi:hypothetical protein
MLALTQEAARAADLPNVQTRVMDAQRLELEPGHATGSVSAGRLFRDVDVRPVPFV